jgi:hypothetical protein
MATDRRLSVAITGGVDIKYSRTDILDGDPSGQRSDKLYGALRRNFSNGRGGRNYVDLCFTKRYTLNNSVLTLDLDGVLTNVWGDILNYDSVKLIVIHNLETTFGKYLAVRFKDERYYIGPEGYREICEPAGQGVQAIVSSSSSEEGGMVISCDTSITFDIIIIGSSQESSSSGL